VASGRGGSLVAFMRPSLKRPVSLTFLRPQSGPSNTTFPASVCTAEMEHANEAKTLHPQTNDLANLITSFECLLWDHGYNVPADHMGYSSAPENLQTSGEVDAAPDSVSRRVTPLRGMSADSE
jgi:hypothetical protein